MSEPITLAPDSVEEIARRVAELLRGEALVTAVTNAPGLIDAAEVARRFSVSTDYVYSHATELGAVRLGDGPKARLRFNPERVVEALAVKPFAPTQPNRRRQHRKARSVELLPIGQTSNRKKESQ